MSSHDRQFIQFSELAPDAVEFDSPLMEVARNVVPAYGSYRPLEKLQRLATVADGEAATGGYCHLVSVGAPDLRVQLEKEGWNAPLLTGNWYTKDMVMLDDADVENYDAEAMRGFLADDTTYIRSVAINDPSTMPEVRYRFETPVRTPTTGTLGDITLRIRFRFVGANAYQCNTHELNWELYDHGTGSIATGTFSYTADHGEWQVGEYEVSVVEQALITDWSLIELRLTPDSTDTGGVPGQERQFDVPNGDLLTTGWVNELGDNDNETLHESIAEVTNGGNIPKTKYITSPILGPDEDSVAIFKLEQPEIWHDPETGGPGLFMDAWADYENMSVKMQIIQPHSPTGDDDEDTDLDDSVVTYSELDFDVLYEETINNVSTNSSDRSTWPTALLTSAQGYNWVEKYTPEKDVFVAIVPTYSGGQVGATTYVVPDGTNKGSGISGTHADVNNCVGGDRALATANDMSWSSTYKKFSLDLASGPKGTADNAHIVWVKASSDASDTIKVKLIQQTDTGPEEVDGETHNLGSNATWFALRCSTAAVKNKLKDYTNLKVEISGGAQGNTSVEEVYMEYPGDSAQVNIGDVYIDTQAGYHMEISLTSLDSVNPKDNNLGDRNEIYVANNDAIYEIEGEGIGFVDVSRSVAPYSGNAYGLTALPDIPKLWSFTSFGDDVIATNYADEPQRRTFGDTQFEDLYDAGSGTQEPYARHVAVIGAQLVFADINPTSYASGKPFHLWCSKPMDPTFFELADIDNMSALFALVGRPGAITGLIGGEYGTVFKRNSIWRMSFVGLPTIYQFDLVADGVGCSHPQSIVQAGSDLYFWDSSGIFVLAGGQQLQRLSGGKIDKALFDSKYEDHALDATFGDDPRQNEALVWGAYDAYSGLVWWLYKSKDGGQYTMDNMVVFSTKENRFTTVDRTDLDLTMILGRQNVWSNEPVLNRGIIGVRSANSGANLDYVKFIADRTYSSALKTKTISTVAWGYNPGRDAEIFAVRPVYKVETEKDPTTEQVISQDDRPNFQITLTAAQDAGFINGKQQFKTDMSRQNPDGWVPVDPLQGEFFQFRVQTPGLYRTNVKEILGLQLKTRQAGDN